MIKTVFNSNGIPQILLVIEEENIDQMKEGKPLFMDMSELFGDTAKGMKLIIGYTPDVMWVRSQLANSKDPMEFGSFTKIIEESLKRPVKVNVDRTRLEMKLNADGTVKKEIDERKRKP